MAQYRRSAQPRGYRPRTVDQGNIARMREDSNRTVQGMRQRAEMEISDRRRVLQEEKENQAATRQMVERNFKIETQNSENELRGLQLKAQQQSKQAAIDAEASAAVFKTIADFSTTAMEYSLKKQEQQSQEDYNEAIGDSSKDEQISEALKNKADTGAQSVAQLNAVQGYESKGGDSYTAKRVKAENPGLQALYSAGYITGLVDRGGWDNEYQRRLRARQEAAGGRPLQYADKREVAAETTAAFYRLLKEDKHNPKYLGALNNKINARTASVLGIARREDEQVYDNQRLNQSLALIENSTSEDLATNWSVAWSNVLDYHGGDYSKAWQAVKPTLTAIDQNGNFLLEMPDIDQMPLYTEDQGETTFGERFSNSKGQAVGIRREIIADRNRARVQFENQQEQAQKASNRQLEDEMSRAFLLNPTTQNGQEMIRMYSELTGGENSTQLNNLVKTNSIEGVHRANEFQRIAALPDYELTPELVAAAKSLNPTESKVIEERYNAGPGQFNTKAVQDLIKKGQTVITGTTMFGTAKLGKPGSIQAQLYFRSEVMKKSKLIYGNGTNGYTVEQAVAQAVQEEGDLYSSTYRTEGSKYYRKVQRNGTVSYPWIDARAGNTQAAAQANRDVTAIREYVKEVGGLMPLLNIPNSFMSPERMDYVAQNYGQPGFQPLPVEKSVQSFSAGMPLHEIYNRAFAATGRKETFGPPAVLDTINFTVDQQRILNAAVGSYSIQNKLNTINVASGNTEVYKAPTHMRAGSPFLIYTSGNIGPTSTGPHLDVKRVDGQEFAPNALDTFVEVEDPELGRVPLSKVPITGDFAEHKARGSHGIDYGLYSGTQVFAKNGAKVVDTQQSEHGDVVTIELPNGLRYTFLHGTAPK